MAGTAIAMVKKASFMIMGFFLEGADNPPSYMSHTKIKVAFKLAFLAILTDGWRLTVSLELPTSIAPGGQYQFLTNLSSLLTVGYAALSLVAELAGCKSRRLAVVHRALFNVELLVTVAYWVLIWIFPRLLNGIDVSLKLDLEIHLAPYLYLLWEYLTYRQHPVKRSDSVALTIAILLGYWVSIEFNGCERYPYPLLNDKTFGERLAWMGAFMAVAVSNEVVVWVFAKKRRQS